MPEFYVDLTNPTKEELDAASKEYDLLYQEACDLVAEFDPCKVEDGTCLRCREGDGVNFCCTGCKHRGAEGCTVKAIWCKLWFCHGYLGNTEALGKHFNDEFSDRIQDLRERINKLPHGIGRGGRHSKQQLFSYYDYEV